MTIQTDDMTGIFAAQLPAFLLQQFHHIAIAHPGALERNAKLLHGMLEGKIGHQRANHPALECSLGMPLSGDDVHQLVAIVQLTLRIHHYQSVTIAI